MAKKRDLQTTSELRIFGIPVIQKRGFTLENPPSWVLDWAGGAKSSSGEDVNAKTSMTFSAVHGCVKIIAETIASLGIGLFERTDDGVSPAIKNQSFKIITGNPSDQMLRFNFYESIISQVLLWGNGYALIRRNNGAKPISIELIDQSDTNVKVLREVNKNTGKTTITYEVDNIKDKIKQEDMLHFAGLGFNGVVGQSVMENFKETTGLALAQKKYAGKFYKNGAQFGIILKHPGVLSEPAQKRLTKSVNESHSTTDQSFKSFLLEEGMELEKITVPLKDAQFIESLKFNVEEIARIYRVPLHLLQQLERSTNNNIEQQDIDFVKHTIRPWLKRIEPELERKLLSEKDKESGKIFVKFNIDSLLRGDTEARIEFYDRMILNGTMNRDEVRALEFMNPIKDGSGKIHTVQSQNIPLKDVGEEDEGQGT
jgi:HK97 family phage portal protein